MAQEPTGAATGHWIPTVRVEEMTLRDYFAAQAIVGCAQVWLKVPDLARRAYELADAMIAERAK